MRMRILAEPSTNVRVTDGELDGERAACVPLITSGEVDLVLFDVFHVFHGKALVLGHKCSVLCCFRLARMSRRWRRPRQLRRSHRVRRVAPDVSVGITLFEVERTFAKE